MQKSWRCAFSLQKSSTMLTHNAKTLAMRCRNGGHSAREVILVDVSDIFYFFLHGEGEGGVRGARGAGGVVVLAKIPGGGGVVQEGGPRGREGGIGEFWGGVIHVKPNIFFGAETSTKLFQFHPPGPSAPPPLGKPPPPGIFTKTTTPPPAPLAPRTPPSPSPSRKKKYPKRPPR